MNINWNDINWGALIGVTVGIWIFIAPFAYKNRRERGGTHIRAVLDMVLLFFILFLWITGMNSMLYGFGVVIDRPAQQLGSGGFEPAESHGESIRGVYILLGLVLMAAGWVIGKVIELLGERKK